MDLKRELEKVFKFLIVGGSTFFIQSGCYLLFSRLVLPDMNRTAVFVLANLISIIFNYSVNRAWTFGDQASAKGSARRYAYVVVAASCISAFLFWLGHDLMQIYDMIVVVAVNAIIPFFTFVTHRLYTFHPEPHKIVKRIVRSGPDSV